MCQNRLETFRNKMMEEVCNLTKKGRLTDTDCRATRGAIEKADAPQITKLIVGSGGDPALATNMLVAIP